MIFRTSAAFLALCLAAATTTAKEVAPIRTRPATRFDVSGPDIAGQARVEGGAVRVQLTRFWTKGPLLESEERTLQGEVITYTRERIEWSYTRRVKRGILGTVGQVFTQLPWRASRHYDETVEVTLLRNAAGDYVGTIEGVEHTWSFQPDLSDVVVLVVPGLSTNLWNQSGVPYLNENLATLRARGLSARRLDINTEESVSTNAAHIAREIRKELQTPGKRVLLFAHSKGATDAMACLANPTNRCLLPRVAGLIAIQPVYGGSDVADLVAKHGPLQRMARVFFEKVLPAINRETSTGSGDAVGDLQTEVRQALLRRHPYPANLVPTVVIRSSIHVGKGGRRIWKLSRHPVNVPLPTFAWWLKQRYGVTSDGMVTLAKQRVPGAVAEVTLADLDHFEPGLRGESPHSPSDITNLALGKILPFLRPTRRRGKRVLPKRRLPIGPKRGTRSTLPGLPFPH